MVPADIIRAILTPCIDIATHMQTMIELDKELKAARAVTMRDHHEGEIPLVFIVMTAVASSYKPHINLISQL